MQNYIHEAIIKQYQWARADSRSRLFIKSLILGDISAARRKGFVVEWYKEGVLYVPFTSYKVK